MKSFLKILFFILSMLTTVGEIKSSTVVNSPQERILASSFQEAELIPIGFEKHSGNSCLNGEGLVSYSEQGTNGYCLKDVNQFRDSVNRISYCIF